MWHDPVTRYTLGISAMFGFYWLCKHFIVSPFLARLKPRINISLLLDTALLYLPGLGLLLLFIRNLPVFEISPYSFRTEDYFVALLAQFFAFVLMVPISNLETKFGLVSSQALEKQSEEQSKGINVFLLMIVVPFMEELLFRKMLGDLLGSGQTALFLCLSALVFSLIHLQTGRIAVAIGMFYNGFLWAWVYAGSGSLLLCAALHILFNLMMDFIPNLLKKTSSKAHGLYFVGLVLAGIAGFVMLVSNLKHYLPPELWDTPNPWQLILANWGIWALVIVCAFSYLQGHRAQMTKKR